MKKILYRKNGNKDFIDHLDFKDLDDLYSDDVYIQYSPKDKNNKQRKKMKIVKLGKEFCTPCRVIGNQLKELCNKEEIQFEDIDLDKNPSLIDEYKIDKIPVVLIKDDEENVVWRKDGYMTVRIVENKIKELS